MVGKWAHTRVLKLNEDQHTGPCCHVRAKKKNGKPGVLTIRRSNLGIKIQLKGSLLPIHTWLLTGCIEIWVGFAPWNGTLVWPLAITGGIRLKFPQVFYYFQDDATLSGFLTVCHHEMRDHFCFLWWVIGWKWKWLSSSWQNWSHFFKLWSWRTWPYAPSGCIFTTWWMLVSGGFSNLYLGSTARLRLG